jgi:hypothetical protein
MNDSTTAEVLARADQNMVLSWSNVIGTIKGSSRHERDGALMLASGMPIPLFNPSFVCEEVTDPQATAASVIDFYGRAGLPFALYFRDDVCPGLAEACSRAGLIEHFQPPLMVMDPIVPAPPPPAGLAISVVDASTAPDHLRVLAESFEAPLDVIQHAFGAGLTETPGLTAWVGFLEGVPVATSAVSMQAGLAGVYNVATIPSARGKGIGAALTWTAVSAGASSGATISILQASEAGQPVYARMGFATPARYRQFEGAP